MRSIEQAFDLPPRGLPSRHPRDPRPGHAPARLTRRGRLVIVLATLLLLLVAAVTLGRVASQAAGPARPLPTVTVQPGETLWQIAGRVAANADRRALVREIELLNHITSGRVVVGQQLRLPR